MICEAYRKLTCVIAADIMAEGSYCKRSNYKSITSTTPEIDLIAERMGAEI